MRCPVCRAENTEGPACRRCRADLSLLFALEEQRAELMARAVQAARSVDWPEVARLAGEANALRRAADATQLLAVAALLQRDFGRAWDVYRMVPR